MEWGGNEDGLARRAVVQELLARLGASSPSHQVRQPGSAGYLASR